MIWVPPLILGSIPFGVQDKHRPQPTVPHHHKQMSPPLWLQFLALMLGGKDVGAATLWVPF